MTIKQARISFVPELLPPLTLCMYRWSPFNGHPTSWLHNFPFPPAARLLVWSRRALALPPSFLLPRAVQARHWVVQAEVNADTISQRLSCP